MKMFRLPMVLVVVAFLGAAVAQDDDTQALNEIHRQWQVHYNDANLDGLTNLYSEDAVIMPPNAPEATGHDALRASTEGYLEAGAARIELAPFTDLRVGGDVAWAATDYTFYDAEGNLLDEGKSMLAYEKVNGEWRIARHMWSSNLPPAGAGGAAGE